MEVCLCANYYSSVRCTNTVSKFGQRCKLCTVLKSGNSLSPGLLPEDCLWMTSYSHGAQEQDDSPEKSMTTTRRPSWTFAGMVSLSTSSKKSSPEAGTRRKGRTNARV